MTKPMPRHERLAHTLVLLREIIPDAQDRSPGASDDAETSERLDRVLRDVVPPLNDHLRALGARPVDPDRVYRGKERPAPGMHLLLLGMRLARRLETIEVAYLRSRPEGRSLIDQAYKRLVPPAAPKFSPSDEPVSF